MSLLQTPQFKKKTSGRTEKERPPSAIIPQSILRVRQVMRRSPSPSSQGSPEAPLPPPLPKSELKVSMPPTPQKHLRFTEDTRGATPSPDVIQMGESSSEPSPEEGSSSPQRGPSPEFMTPPSGSPVPEEEMQDEPKLTFEERLDDSKEESQELKLAQEPQVTLDDEKNDEEMIGVESKAAETDPERSEEREQRVVREKHDEVIDLELEQEEDMGEEVFHDVENTEDLAIPSSGPEVVRETEEKVEETVEGPVQVEEPSPSKVQEEVLLEKRQEEVGEKEEEKDKELEEQKEIKISDDEIRLPSKEIAAPLAGSAESDHLLESADVVQSQEDVDVEKNIGEDILKMEEGSDDEDSEITFNFHVGEDASKIRGHDEEDESEAVILKEQETEGLPIEIAPLLPRESGDSQYDKNALPRPPIHALPREIEEKWGSPTRSSTTHFSPDHSLHLGEPHPFPTPPQRTDTDEEVMEDSAVGGLPLPPAPTRVSHLRQENIEIQTSPFVIEEKPHEMATASSQTTPGLGLTPRAQTSQKRAPFNMSLRSQSKMQSPAPVPAPLPSPLSVPEPVTEPTKDVQEDKVHEEETWNTDERVSATPFKEPPPLISQKVQKESPTEKTPAKPPPSFIFSPPSTRSKSRRKTMASISREMPRDQPSESIMSHVSLARDISLISSASSPVLPKSTNHPPVRKGRRSVTPTSSPNVTDLTVETRSVRRSRRSATPTTSPAVIDVTVDISQEEITPPVVTRRMTRSRHGKTLPEQEPSESPINLISPVKEEEGNEKKPKQGSQKVVRIPRHSMSLRTSSKKNRSMKYF